MSKGLFYGCQITLELDSSIPFKKKTAVKQAVIDNGGIISFIVTKKVLMHDITIHCMYISTIDYPFSCQ